MNTKTPCIYCITSPSNKQYIGQTKNYNQRMNRHKNMNDDCILLNKAIKTYGWENIKKEILICCNIEHLDDYEKKFIDLYNTLVPNGYNCTSGGKGMSKPVSNETKEKLKQANLGKKLSEETKEKLRQINLGKIMSDESKVKMSNSKKEMWNNIKENNKEHDYLHTEETKKKISETIKQLHKNGLYDNMKNNLYNSIHIICYNINKPDIKYNFNSLTKAGEFIQCSRKTIKKYCENEKEYNGWVFKYNK